MALCRRVIDRLVAECEEGQGQVAAMRARAGMWNRNASPDAMPDQWRMNQLLSSLAPDQRQVLADMLSEQFASGVHEALVVLHEEGVAPLDDGYEGDPFSDFAGRMIGWDWPTE